ncbi:LysR family transcriptional regulator [Amycolatopsis sp. K13G38]|uniref:LysR family transcriptional regulator n=1 Tax=Amycolatopsis acididurans TaxID=2724524 RepID=A0ABX1JFK9_9PSEU|nr:LysR family transcriptional regulator [Amycolatopsis acididurans]NKQ57530.1 LysR family transcriptional regulator [Amycolatopsis acididurans]
MDLTAMRTFLTVYRCGSSREAARFLGLSPLAVGAQLGAMESELGRRLFDHSSGGAAPTDLADEFAREIAVHVDALAAIAGRDPCARPVRLAGPAELTTVRVLPALGEQLRRGLKVRVEFATDDEAHTGLAGGRFDVVVSTSRPCLRGLAAVPLAEEELVLIGAKPWTTRLHGDRSQALQGVPLVADADELSAIRRYWRAVFGGPPANGAAVVVPDLRGVLAAVVAGAGVGVLPRYLCEAALADGSVTQLVRPERPPTETVCLAARAGTLELPHLAPVRACLLAGARHW